MEEIEDLFIIKRQTLKYDILVDYFYNTNLNSNKEYFVENKIINKSELNDSFFKIPFQFVQKLHDSIKYRKGVCITKSIRIPCELW